MTSNDAELRLTLHLTGRCNLACSYCFADCSSAASPPHQTDMSGDVGRAAINWALEHTSGPVRLSFFGGEPALKLPLIESLADHARRHGKDRVAFEITTNGSLINRRFIDVVTRHRMIVAVSIDGGKQAHDAHRRLPNGNGSFELVTKNIKPLLQRAPWTLAYSVVTPKTAGIYSSSIEALVELGFRIILTWPDQSAPWNETDAKTLRRELDRLADKYIKWTRGGQRVYISAIDGAIRSHVREASDDCTAGSDQFSVGPSGTLYPCVQFVGADDDHTYSLGNVQTGLDAKRVEAFAKLTGTSPKECGDCQLSSRCAARCACAALTATGNPAVISPIQCALQKLSIPIADRAARKLYRSGNVAFIHKHYNRLYPVAHCIEAALESAKEIS